MSGPLSAQRPSPYREPAEVPREPPKRYGEAFRLTLALGHYPTLLELLALGREPPRGIVEGFFGRARHWLRGL